MLFSWIQVIAAPTASLVLGEQNSLETLPACPWMWCWNPLLPQPGISRALLWPPFHTTDTRSGISREEPSPESPILFHILPFLSAIPYPATPEC